MHTKSNVRNTKILNYSFVNLSELGNWRNLLSNKTN